MPRPPVGFRHHAARVAALAAALVVAVRTPAEAGPPPPQERTAPADLVLIAGAVHTAERSAGADATAVAVRGERIVAVGSERSLQRLVRRGRTRVVRAPGALVVPGFIDNHVHFAQAGRLLLGLNLLDVNDEETLRERVRAAAARLPPGAWLRGGDWGAYAQWRQGSAGGSSRVRELAPARTLIDPVTGDHPALVSRFDGQAFLANTLALRSAGIDASTPDPPGGQIVRDETGRPTGLLLGSAGRLVEAAIPPPSREQRRREALRALEEARRWGVTTVHDNVPDLDHLELLRELRAAGDLTVRVWARMPLADWEKVRDHVRERKLPAVRGGWGDDTIRLGGLKAWVDGIMGNSTALFLEPYRHRPDSVGKLRDVMFPEGNLERLLLGADRAGFTATVHAIGDKANRILLDTYERVFAANGPRDRRFRVVHAQVVHPADLPRFGALGLVAEVQPYHCIDDMRWMEERIGERARNAYPFRRLRDAGARLTFGSDWPGTNASYYPINPLLGIYAAATRQTLEGQPERGWFPAERIGIEDALRAYTADNAWSTFEEASKGHVAPGLLADLAVLDRDIRKRPARELLETQVLYTIVGGRVVHEAPPAGRR
jgi:predicted amidohydrolase YtcJ